jgi:hypothetical protein
VTKVQLQFRLDKPLDTKMMSNLERASALYGILRLKLSPAMDGLTVEYDATRLRENDVKAALARAGIAVEQAQKNRRLQFA